MSTKRKVLIAILSVLLIGAIVLGVLYYTDKPHMELVIEGKTTEYTVEVGDKFTAPKGEAFYKSLFVPHGDDVDVAVSGTVDTEKIGTYEIKYKAEKGSTIKESTVTVKVVDTEAPVISLKKSDNPYTSPGKKYKEEGFTATDNYDGDLTDKVVRTETKDNVTYSVTDSSGNEAKIVRQIIYKDVVKPKIKIKGDSDMLLIVGEKYEEKGATATDDVDGDITAKIEVSGSVDPSKKGSYSITYKVTDSSGNEARATRSVYVVDKQKDFPTKNPGKKVIYLTFDDGPGQYTAKLLTVLAKYNVKATFFVTNQFSKYSNMIGKEAKAGHSVAVHSYSHNYSKIYSSVNGFHNDIEKMNDLIEKQTGKRSHLLRFPGGTGNTVSRKYKSGIMKQLSHEVGSWGYKYFDWNVDSGDAGGTTSTSKVVSNVKAGCSKHDVSIVLQHDIKGYSVNAVEQIIKWGLANGYTFLPLTESSPTVHTKPRN